MSRRTRPAVARGRRITGTVLGLALAAFTVAACGEEQDVTSATSTPQNSAATSVAEQPAEPPSTSPPVVGGRKPVSQTDRSTPAEESDTTCGTVPGPDGALRVLRLAGDVSCDTASTIAKQYGPKIATGQQQSVAGWTCAPSQLPGVLSACQKGESVIGFAP